MKKLLVFLGGVSLLFCLGGSAYAVPWTWTDVYTDPGGDVYLYKPLIGSNNYTYTHDIRDEYFDPLEDLVLSAVLYIDFYDDGFDPFQPDEEVKINLPGLVGDQLYDFSYANPEFGMSFLALVQLNLTGELTVTLRPTLGDFYFAQSTLEACGLESNPVPEPATLLLFGTGLFGIAGLARKLKK